MTRAVNLDLDLLRSFATIAEASSFTRAADRLGRTQSTISLQLKRLEDAVGHRLLDRSARHVRLTPEGEVLLAYARDILRIADEALVRLTEPDLAGLVRLGTPEDFATTHLPRVLARFARSHPKVTLEVHCDLTMNLWRGYEAGEFDLVLVKREPQGAARGVRVWREPLVWAAAPGLQPADGDSLSLVVSPAPCVYRKRAIEALDGQRRRWRIAYTSQSLAGNQAAVRAGLGITILPKEMVPQGLQILGAEHGLPDLDDTEVALLTAPGGLGLPAARLAEHIIQSLERDAH